VPSYETAVQLSTRYTDPERRNTLCHRQTDRRTDGRQYRTDSQ